MADESAMARFFKFHSLAEIDAECRRQGLAIRFSEDLSPLFRPVNVGPFRVGNSMCIQPMEGCDGTLDGRPDELTFRRYRRFGTGGAKLIWAEATAVIEEGRANSRQLLLNEQTAPDLEEMLRQCRLAHREACGSDDDLLVGLQLTHSGRYSYRRPLLAVHDPVLDPSTVADRSTGRKVDAGYPLLDDDYLARLVDHYIAAARLAAKIGFQFVDVKQCHAYLLSELLTARDRPGRYGGSLENRTRLARDIIRGIRAAVPNLMIASRVNVGPADSESHWWIDDMEKLGVSLINISMGSPYTTPHLVRPFEYPPPDGYDPPEHPLHGVNRHFTLTEQLQRAFPQLPMVGSGYSYLQEYLFHAGAANLRDGRVTFVGVGRAALAQPDFARQLQEHGRLDRKRVCRTFSYCTALMRSKHNELGQFATGCPPFDKDVYGPIWQQAKKQDNHP
jgi:NADPH2 dehydrogenase